jgi:SNF2 family DNA or RNA helicase
MIELYDHQKVALQYLRLYEGFALFHQQGLGKTICMLSHLARLALAGEIESALVIAPKAPMGAWTRDIAKFPPAERIALEQILTVINYESVWRKGKGYDKVWDCIVLDESHKIKNRTTKQSSFILKLALKARYRYILTGTPIGNGRLEDLWSQYAFLYPKLVRGRVASKLFGTWSQFTDKYCILDQYWKPSRYINVDEFQEIMDMYCHRVTKEEALDLPDKLPDEIYDIELKEKKLYKELHKDGASLDYDLLLENPLARLTKLRQVCSGFLTLEDKEVVELKSEKLKALEDFLDGWEKKLVIFCEYKYSIRSISKLLKKLKFKHVILDGEQKDKDIWKQFQSDESIRVIICQYQSGAQGIDLFAADTIIYYEPTLSSTTLEQSRDRIHRMGQTQKCSYIHFITKKSVEENIYKALAKYEDFSEKLFESYIKEYIRSYSGGRR